MALMETLRPVSLTLDPWRVGQFVEVIGLCYMITKLDVTEELLSHVIDVVISLQLRRVELAAGHTATDIHADRPWETVFVAGQAYELSHHEIRSPEASEVRLVRVGWQDPEPASLTSADPEPKLGTVVRDSAGVLWYRTEANYGDTYWIRIDQPGGDPESWAKVAGNYGPITVVRP